MESIIVSVRREGRKYKKSKKNRVYLITMNSENTNEPFLKFRIPRKSTSIAFVDAMSIIESLSIKLMINSTMYLLMNHLKLQKNFMILFLL